MTESYIIPEFDENGNFLSDDVKARIVEMIESNIIPEFDENGNILRDDVKARIVEMIEAHAPTPAPSNPGPEIITLDEGHPKLAGSLAEPLPDDLPVGSYLVNEPRFMGYRLSQKTPLGWDIKDFDKTIQYSTTVTPPSPRMWVMRGDTPIEGVSFSGLATSTADSLRISLNIWGGNFIKGEEVTVLIEGPQYDLVSGTALSHEYASGNGTDGPEGVTHYVIAYSTSFSMEGESTTGLRVRVIVGRDNSNLPIDATFGLRTPPDMRPYDALYVPPSERVEVEVPEPTYVEADDHMSCTVTIPEVEGVRWRISFQFTDVEPGVYEVQMADRQKFDVYAHAEKGYYIKNNDALGEPWQRRMQWSYAMGLPITAPMPEPLNATTEGGVAGWMVRYPEVEHVSYWFDNGTWSNQIKVVLTGDAFTPIGKRINAEADLPYYITNPYPYPGTLRADGTIS